MKEKIDEGYREKITLQPELDLFIGLVYNIRVVRALNDTYRVISLSITQVLRDLEITVEPFLLTMTRTTWMTLESVSGQQAHIIEMVAAVDSFMEVTKSQLEQKKYLRNFYDKAAAFVFPTPVVRFSKTWLQTTHHKVHQCNGQKPSLEGNRSRTGKQLL